MSTGNKTESFKNNGRDQKITDIFAKYSNKKDYIITNINEDFQKAFLLWLGWALDLHDGTLAPDNAIKIIIIHIEKKGFQDPRGPEFQENIAALWNTFNPEDNGVFHYNMLAKERYSVCQWSGNWTISGDSIQCVIAR